MTSKFRRAFAASLAAAVIGTCAEAADITASESSIELKDGQTSFSFEIGIEEEKTFAGAEFGITLPDGVTLVSVDYLDDTIKSASHTPVVVKNGCAYFGFYVTENSFSGTYNAARLTFEYEKDEAAEIKLDSSGVIFIDSEGKTESDKGSEPFTVEILRAGTDGSENGANTGGGSGGSCGGAVYYTVSFDTMGGSETDSARVRANGTAEEPEEPVKAGFVFDGWYTDRECTQKFDFTSRITRSMTLYAKWTEEQAQQGESGWINPFKDVSETDWFYSTVRFVNENGLFGGISETEFAPYMSITRGMVVTVLHRLENSPEAAAGNTFADVEPDAYYANSVAWAEDAGIVKGYSEAEFGPDDIITREQLAAVLQRYANTKGIETEAGGDIEQFADRADISAWAEESMRWAVGSGIITGRGSTVDPSGNATRAETAAMIQRLTENAM